MDAWNGKVAVVTGASAGIGASVCTELSKFDIQVVGLARREDRLNQLKKEIESSNKNAKFHPIKCDLTKEEDIKSAFDEVIKKFGGVDILINNAGILGNKSILEDDSDEICSKIIQTNLIGVVSCTKKAYKSMTSRDVPGYIITVSSTAGHTIPSMGPMKPIIATYPCSKYALTALNQVLRQELNYYKQNKIRISNISPGAVSTEIAEASENSDIKMDGSFFPVLEPKDVSDAIIYMLGTPLRVQIQDIIIRPNGETF